LREDCLQLLVRATGRDLPPDAPRLDVFLVGDIQSASPWQPVGSNVSGFYRASPGRVSAIALEEVRGSRSSGLAQALLLHEYAHHFLLGASRTAYPAWYVEGFAEYFSTARFRDDRIEYGEASPIRATALAQARWIPLESLLARDPALMQGSQSAIFYAQSWLLTHYMFRAPGMRMKLAAYLRAYAAGEDPVEAFRTHVDADFRAFQDRLRTYVLREATFSRFERAGAQAVKVTVTDLPPSASDLLLPMVAVEHGVPPARRAEALADLRARAGRHPRDALSARALALAELVLGSPSVAGNLLDAQLNQLPRDADLLRWRAQAAWMDDPRAGGEEARRYLVRAWNADPQDWRTLHFYARIYRSRTSPMPADAMDALLKAYGLAPQVTDVVLDTALALANAGRLAEASQVLEPLAWSPHGGPAAELAQRMLLKARAGDRAGVQAEVAELRRSRLALATAVQRL
jgi:hypothetical protein